MDSGWRIVVDDGEEPRAISKVVPLSDGGYSMLAPYHAANEGWLFKHDVDYSVLEMDSSFSEMQHFVASDRVKLSHHWDGFVQFSGENPQKIISGRDPQTREPKGLAIMSAPMWRPITSGPTFGVVAWGMTDFKQVNRARATDIIFDASEIYYEYSTPGNFNAYHVEGWVFGAHMWDCVRGSGNNARLSLIVQHRPRAASALLEFRVLPLNTTGMFLGMRASRTKVDLGSPSGFVMNAPSNRRYGEHTAETIKAIYPQHSEVSRLESKSLNYEPT